MYSVTPVFGRAWIAARSCITASPQNVTFPNVTIIQGLFSTVNRMGIKRSQWYKEWNPVLDISDQPLYQLWPQSGRGTSVLRRLPVSVYPVSGVLQKAEVWGFAAGPVCRGVCVRLCVCVCVCVRAVGGGYITMKQRWWVTVSNCHRSLPENWRRFVERNESVVMATPITAVMTSFGGKDEGGERVECHLVALLAFYAWTTKYGRGFGQK